MASRHVFHLLHLGSAYRMPTFMPACVRHSLLWLTGVAWLFATNIGVASVTQEQRPASTSPFVEELTQKSSAPTLLTTGFWLILFVAVVTIGYASYRLIERLREQREAERLNEARFEAEALASLLVANSSDDSIREIPLIQSDQPAENLTLEVPFAVSVEVSCKAVLDQLRRAGLLEEIESFVPLHGNSKGAAVLRLRGQRRVLLVPYFETDIFAERQLHGCDALLFVSRSGKGFYIQSLESLIADSTFH